MKTLELFIRKIDGVPRATAWLLSELGQSQGRQELYTSQSPQRLEKLREHAMVESAVSSNRIEGVEVDAARVGTLVFGDARFTDRDEEELRGYRKALEWIHGDHAHIPFAQSSVLRLHQLCRGEIWDAGQYKSRDGDIIEQYPDGRSRLRFRTVPAAETQAQMDGLFDLGARCMREAGLPALLVVAAINLDFLCIHPFRDGNGRVSRLLFLLQCYQAGFQVGRYISLERKIEQEKERYYEVLEQSSQGWHEGRHDPWPAINFLLSTVKEAYREFEQRLGETPAPRGAKTQAVLAAIERKVAPFSLSELRRDCPGVGKDLIRKTLKKLKQEGKLRCEGLGRAATWRKTQP
jgi:Fic family protein